MAAITCFEGSCCSLHREGEEYRIQNQPMSSPSLDVGYFVFEEEAAINPPIMLQQEEEIHHWHCIIPNPSIKQSGTLPLLSCLDLYPMESHPQLDISLSPLISIQHCHIFRTPITMESDQKGVSSTVNIDSTLLSSAYRKTCPNDSSTKHSESAGDNNSGDPVQRRKSLKATITGEGGQRETQGLGGALGSSPPLATCSSIPHWRKKGPMQWDVLYPTISNHLQIE